MNRKVAGCLLAVDFGQDTLQVSLAELFANQIPQPVRSFPFVVLELRRELGSE